MPYSMLPTLALDIGEIVSILIAIGVILSGIFGQANEAKKAKKKRDAAKRGDSESGGSVTQLDEIAQRRRQQLEALARKRRGGSADPQPQNLSVTQAAERKEAQDAYAARSAADRAQETSDTVRWTDTGDRATVNTDVDARLASRRSQLEQKRDQQRELQHELRRRQQQEKARQKAENLHNLQEQQRRDQLLNRQKAMQSKPHVHQPVLTGEEPVHRRVQLSEEDRLAESKAQFDLDQVYAVESPEDSGKRKGGVGRASLESLLGGRGWREALILKEVLDRPVGMREDQG